MKKTLTIDMVSDYACPWCYVGKRRLEVALAQCPDIEASVRLLPFQLSPNIPREGIDRKEHMISIFGEAKAESIANNESGIGLDDDLVIRYVEGSKSPNTLSTHVVSHYALTQGKQSDFAEKVFEAYFAQGENIGDHQVLLQLAEESGLAVDDLAEALASGQGEAELQQQISQLKAKGVTGVPFFIINDKYGFSGAQPVAAFINAFQNISNESA